MFTIFVNFLSLSLSFSISIVFICLTDWGGERGRGCCSAILPKPIILVALTLPVLHSPRGIRFDHRDGGFESIVLAAGFASARIASVAGARGLSGLWKGFFFCFVRRRLPPYHGSDLLLLAQQHQIVGHDVADVQVDDPVHQFEADEAHRKHDARVLVDI